MPALQVTRTFTLLRVCGFKLPQCKGKPKPNCRSNKPNRGRYTRQSANGVPEVLDLRNFTCHNLSLSQFPRPLSAMIPFVCILNFAHRCNRTEEGTLEARLHTGRLGTVIPPIARHVTHTTAEEGSALCNCPVRRGVERVSFR